MKLEFCGADRGCCGCCVNQACNLAVVRVIYFYGMMSFVVDCSLAEQIMPSAGSQEVS